MTQRDLFDQQDPENSIIAEDQTRPYQPLSDEQRGRLLSAFRTWLQAGVCQPKLDDSLLGLDWSLFQPRTFPGHENDTSFQTPPEFMMYALSALDAYVTALLGTDIADRDHGIFEYTCSLKQNAPAELQMELKSSPHERNTGSRRLVLQLLHSFPRLLKARGIEANEIACLLGPGHRMQFAYPGQMVACRSPYLCDRPLELWPTVTLSLAANDELVTRARKIAAFLANTKAEDGLTN